MNDVMQMTSHPPNVQRVEEQDGHNVLSVLNSTTVELDDTDSWTGEWEPVLKYPGVVVRLKSAATAVYYIEYSIDKTEADSSLVRYHKSGEIHVPHRFTNSAGFFRVKITNNSGSNAQTYQIQSILGNHQQLNAPLDSVLAQDFDAIVVRPSDYKYETALSLRQGHALWNKFGYNSDIDIGTEIIASFGGTYTPRTTASTLTIVSTSVNDTNTNGSGCRQIVIFGIDANRDLQTEVVNLNGTSNVVTTTTWLGINRVAMYLCGSGMINDGTITITATTGGANMAQMPVGVGVTQQCLFFVPRNHQFIVEWIRVNTLKQSGGINPKITIKMWVFSAVSNGKQEVYRVDIDTSVSNDVDEELRLPFPISEQTIIWLEGTTDQNNTIVNARFSGILVKDVDA